MRRYGTPRDRPFPLDGARDARRGSRATPIAIAVLVSGSALVLTLAVRRDARIADARAFGAARVDGASASAPAVARLSEAGASSAAEAEAAAAAAAVAIRVANDDYGSREPVLPVVGPARRAARVTALTAKRERRRRGRRVGVERALRALADGRDGRRRAPTGARATDGSSRERPRRDERRGREQRRQQPAARARARFVCTRAGQYRATLSTAARARRRRAGGSSTSRASTCGASCARSPRTATRTSPRPGRCTGSG